MRECAAGPYFLCHVLCLGQVSGQRPSRPLRCLLRLFRSSGGGSDHLAHPRIRRLDVGESRCSRHMGLVHEQVKLILERQLLGLRVRGDLWCARGWNLL